MRLKFILLLAVGTVAASMSAAVPTTDDFEAFRRGLFEQHEQFRSDIMKNYADFLDAAWQEYESIKGENRNPKPKPSIQPTVSDKISDSHIIPAPKILPAAEAEKDVPPPRPRDYSPMISMGGVINFYNIAIDVPTKSLSLNGRLTNGNDFANRWREYSANTSIKELAKSLGSLAAEMGFNDYLTFDFVRQYVNQTYSGTHSTSRASLIHYIMTFLGYDVRLAMSNGEGVLLVPTQQTIYGSPYLVLDSRKFYVFADENAESGSRISTCELPADASIGRALDMHLTGALNLPYKKCDFRLECDGITLSGSFNENIYPVLYRYPQTDLEVYASSVIDPELRQNLVEQLKSQLSGKERLEAVNQLLHFTQNALDYATDDDFHGFEKPYFLEEWLYYPKNDCEDRSVFYSYMLWNVLGVECQMITYPGHESVSVRLDETIDGDYYMNDGQSFYISDPTYLGAHTGQCMPQYIDTAPEIEYHYHY